MARQGTSLTRARHGLRVLGFPVAVRPGFFAFMALLVLLYPFPLGLWLAGAVASFTLVHELGHALAARAAGCSARISLDFMVAYAAYEPRRPLAWWHRAGIAVAGPGLQIAAAFAVLAVLGASPFSRSSVSASDLTLAVWWAGLALGLVNLIPLVPLDGGAIVASVIDSFSPGRGRPVMTRVSFAVTLFALAVLLFTPWRSAALFLGLLAFAQWQALAIERMDPATVMGVLEEQWRDAPTAAGAVENARIALSLGSADWALAWLDAAERTSFDGEFVPLLDGGAGFAELLGDPRYSALRERVGI